MTIRVSEAVAKAGLNAQLALIDAGVPDSNVVIYNGARPATVDTAITGQIILVTFPLPGDTFPDAVTVGAEARATANAINPANAVASNNAQFFRVFDGDGNAIMDGTVTDTSGNGDMKMANVALLTGLEVKIVSWVASVPLETP